MSENSLQYDKIITIDSYVEREYKKWEELYVISYEEEYNIKLLLQLRYEIFHTKPEHTKTKLDLIEMAQRIQSRLKLHKRQPEDKDNKNFSLLIVSNVYNNSILDLFKMLLGSKNLKTIKGHRNYGEIETYDGITIFITPKTDMIRGKKVDYYLNLTGDMEYENKVLEKMLKH
jgi:hypothetical protein